MKQILNLALTFGGTVLLVAFAAVMLDCGWGR